MAFRRTITSGMFVWLFSVSPAGANTQAVDRFDMNALETRLFQHDNRSLPMNERLDRLDLFVFGKVKTTTPDQRIAALKKMVSRLELESSMEARPSLNAPRFLAPAAGSRDVSLAVREDAEGMGSQLSENQTEAIDSQSAASEKISKGMVHKVAAMERAVFSRNFDGDPILTRIHRLENQVLPSIVVAEGEPLALRVGRLDDKINDLKQLHEIPIVAERPFDEQTYVEESKARLVAANQLQSDDDLVKEINQLADLSRAADYGDTRYLEGKNKSQSQSHGFRHAMFDTLRTFISAAAYGL